MKKYPETVKLLNCPFCNSDIVSCYQWTQSEYWSVSCNNDNCPLSNCLVNRFESKEEAESWWNIRYAIKYFTE